MHDTLGRQNCVHNSECSVSRKFVGYSKKNSTVSGRLLLRGIRYGMCHCIYYIILQTNYSRIKLRYEYIIIIKIIITIITDLFMKCFPGNLCENFTRKTAKFLKNVYYNQKHFVSRKMMHLRLSELYLKSFLNAFIFYCYNAFKRDQ